MEAPLKSDALITASYANEFGRYVYVLPGKIDDIKFQEYLHLINQGASVINQNLS